MAVKLSLDTKEKILEGRKYLFNRGEGKTNTLNKLYRLTSSYFVFFASVNRKRSRQAIV